MEFKFELNGVIIRDHFCGAVNFPQKYVFAFDYVYLLASHKIHIQKRTLCENNQTLIFNIS